jgi:hypothetical protein
MGFFRILNVGRKVKGESESCRPLLEWSDSTRILDAVKASAIRPELMVEGKRTRQGADFG